ncbi:histidine phosphatase family protein, partial [Klebsiella pneumoniae]|uniref:histidine phosphatase family protein n=1 Tax=Klebsiella pneumoniae TaxID=573 RepID=UPI003218651A
SAHNPDPSRAITISVVLTVILGSLCASFLNAANNTLNQIYDLEIDRINKPRRPLVTGAIGIRQAWTSPLARCTETAALLGWPDARRDDRLAEMRWGDWEGRRLADLRAEGVAAMQANEARGLDFRPAGGESP